MPIRSLHISTVSALAALLGAAPAALAQTAMPVTQDVGHFYFGAAAGVIIPQDLHSTFSGAVAGSGDLSFDAGAAFTGLVGYHLTEQLTLEGELGFGRFDISNFSGVFNGVAVNAAVDGHIDTFSGFGNVIATPWGRQGFSPYFGVGIGFVNFDQRLDAIGGATLNTSSSETDFAANLVAGFDMPLVDRWTIGARYRFIWANTESTTVSNGVATHQDDFFAHVITANATFKF
jgi:OmpA-OmpF porin, OOP family